MAASKAIVANKETCAAFEPCLWGDFFVTYTPPPLQRSEEWMRERRDQLKGEVRQMFDDGRVLSVGDTVRLVDTLERLGIDNHFVKEIDTALYRVHNEELDFGNDTNDLHWLPSGFVCLDNMVSGYLQMYLTNSEIMAPVVST